MGEAARLLSILEATARLPTAPYHEGEVIAHAEAFAAANGLHARRDRFGNVVLRTPAAAPAAGAAGHTGRPGGALVLAAHMDHPGFEITDTSKGLVEARWMGGVEPEYFGGARVRVFSSPPTTGVCVRAELHAERRRVDRMFLDLEGEARVGDHGTWNVLEWDLDGPLVHTRAADDLAGCAAVLAALAALAADATPAFGLLTRAEEVGFVGALGAVAGGAARPAGIPPGAPILTVEASHARGRVRQGDGPVIRVGDRQGVFDPGLCRLLHDVAESIRARHADFVFQRALMDGGTCESTPYNLHGHPSAGIALPLGNYHNRADDEAGPGAASRRLAAETIHVADFFGAVTLLVETARAVATAPGDAPAWTAALARHRDALAEDVAPGLRRMESDGLAGEG